ncbi:hypothetical protein DDD63_07900 [Actinobaculum sp. 313]|nr:hypothetical protein DDD63_07900 [Actinobaculum sp. 313]
MDIIPHLRHLALADRARASGVKRTTLIVCSSAARSKTNRSGVSLRGHWTDVSPRGKDGAYAMRGLDVRDGIMVPGCLCSVSVAGRALASSIPARAGALNRCAAVASVSILDTCARRCSAWSGALLGYVLGPVRTGTASQAI